MAKKIVELSLFISCPSNLGQLRGVAEAAIDEISAISKVTSGISLKHISWKEDIVPGVASDGQQVINQQTLGEYDIYLGMLGSSFGTSTPRAGSGTEEEFDLALEQFRNHPTTIRILFYLQAFGTNPFSLNPSELAKVLAFKSKLSERGVLYKELESLDDALSAMKKHLLKLISDEWDAPKNCWKDPVGSASVTGFGSESASVKSSSEVSEPQVQFGLLDLYDLGSRGIQLAGKSLRDLGLHLDVLTQHSQDLTDALTSEMTGEGKRSQIEDFADSIERFVAEARGELANLRFYLAQGSDNWELFYRLVRESGITLAEPASEVIAAVESVEPSLKSFRSMVQLAKSSVGQIPPMTQRLILAGNGLTEVFDSISLELTLALERLALLKTRLADC